MDEGLRTGRFIARPRELYLSLIGGLSVGAIHTMITGPVAPGFADEAAGLLLCGLGIGADEARQIAGMAMDLPEPPPDTLLGRIMAATAC